MPTYGSQLVLNPHYLPFYHRAYFRFFRFFFLMVLWDHSLPDGICYTLTFWLFRPRSLAERLQSHKSKITETHLTDDFVFLARLSMSHENPRKAAWVKGCCIYQNFFWDSSPVEPRPLRKNGGCVFLRELTVGKTYFITFYFKETCEIKLINLVDPLLVMPVAGAKVYRGWAVPPCFK